MYNNINIIIKVVLFTKQYLMKYMLSNYIKNHYIGKNININTYI